MNKSYRTVWNATTGTWTAAAETARMRTKSKSNSAMRSSVTAAVAVMAGVGGGAMSADANAQAANGNGSLTLCTPGGSGGYYGSVFGGGSISGTRLTGCGAAVSTFRLSEGHVRSFQLYNNSAANGSGAGQASAATEAGISGTVDGHLFLLGGSGVHLRGPVDVDSNVDMTNHRINNLAAGTAGTDAVNVNQLNTAIANAKAADNPYIKIIGSAAGISDTAASASSGSVAMGRGAVAGAVYTTAIGNDSHANGQSSTAVGVTSSASGSQSVVVGNSTFAGNQGTAIGYGANARGANAAALGTRAAASGGDSLALGTNASAAGTGAVALGYGSEATRNNTVSVGKTGAERQIANVAAGTQGTDAVNLNQLNTAIAGVKTSDNPYVKIVGNTAAEASGMGSVSIGSGSVARSGSSGGNIAIGNGATADTSGGGYGTMALGYGAKAGTSGYSGGMAIGLGANSTHGNVAIGDGAQASGKAGDAATYRGVTAIGNNATANAASSVALGYLSVADRDNSVSVGSSTLQRQITNVAAGTADTDAVNVSQLKGSGLIGDDGKSIAAVTYDRNADGTPNYGTVTLGNGNGPTQIKNVADAKDDHDALNLGQLKDAGLVGDDGAGKLTSAAVTYDKNADGTINHDKATLAGTSGTTLSNVKAGVADMDAVNVSQLKGSGLIGDDGKSIAAVTYDRNADGTPNYGTVTLGNGNGPTQIKNVADAKDDHDALNLGQLKDTGLVGEDGAGKLTSLAVTYDGAAKDSVTLGGTGATAPVALHNVADGVLSATSKDAVNGSQLFATNTRVGDLEDSLSKGGVIDPVTGESLAVVYDSNAKDTVTLKGTNGTTLSNVKAGAADMDAVNVSQLKGSGLIGDDGKSIAAVTYDRNADGTPNYGTVTLGNGNGPTQVKNVATGVEDTDAVNVKQLTSGLSDLKDEMSRADLRFVKVNADPVTGTPAIASGALAVAIGSDARATSANSLALGSGARVTGAGSVAIGYNSVANQNNVVSVGDVGRERKIVNVADGDVAFQSTDAVNGGQLYAALNTLSTSVTSKTQQAIDTFSTEIDKKTKAAIDEVSSRSMQPMDVSDPLVAIEGLQGNNVASLNGADPATATAAAIGSSTAASGANAVAIGLQSGAGSNNSVALGSFAQTGAGQDYSVAMGSNVQTNGTQAVAMGANTQANGDYALAIGNNGAQAVGDSSIAVGNGANVRAGATNAMAIGTGANVARNVEGAMALGANSTSGAANSIALGSNSFSNRADTLSVGRAGAERQIVNVAAGTQATDAVNVSQLKGVTDSLGGGTTIGADGSITKPTYNVGGTDYHNVGDALDALEKSSGNNPLAVAYDSAAKDTVTLGGVGATTPVALKNVADAKDDHDALNLGQLKNAGLVGDDGAGNLTSAAVTYDKNADGTINHDKATLAGTSGTTLSNVKAGVADMDAVNVSQLKGSGLIGDDGKSIAAVTYDRNADGTPNYGSVTLGNGTGPTQLKNVADATDDGDALNLGQLKNAGLVGEDGAGKLTSAAVTYDKNADGTINHDKATLAGTSGTTLSNVKAGVADMDAVNVSQLKDAGLIDPSTGKPMAAVTYDSAAKDTVTLGGVGATTPVALKNVADAKDDHDALNLGQLKDTGLVGEDGAGKLTSLAVTYDGASKDSVTLGGTGATAPVALHNIADGVLSATSKDAVNGSQLFATNTRVGDLEDSLKQGGVIDPTTGESLAVVYDSTAKNSVTLGNAGTPVGIHNLAAGTVNATSNDAINGSQLFTVSKSVADKIGGGAGVGADGSITDPTYSVGGQDYHNVGDALDALDKNSGNNPLAVAYDSAAKDTVTLGGVGATTPVALKNVADAKDDHDALNLGQLKNAGLVGDDGAGNLTSAAVTYDKNADGTINHDKATLAGTSGTTLSNVKAGVADMDAVNVSQLKGSGLIGDDGKSIAAVTYDRNADGTPNYGSVTLGNGTGPTQLKNVADATDDGDALNLGQLKNAGLVGEDGAGKLTSA
ncbi:ESPR-type extended signal peptide-containing protein, partial [Burkholderia cenocepacia]|uniref:ESPR-type extended signal peptide-containing protein n=1 Tax=Burkholderia cenocepacia TaxID=95486 RepID=UPI0009812846